MTSIDIRTSGPLFDGRAAHAAHEACGDARDDIAAFAEEHVLIETGIHFKHPTGYYESNVHTTNVTADSARVWDNGIVYGPWLEGVGSRNYPVTRFKGYSHWRRTKQLTQARAPQLADRAIQRHLPGMR